MKISTRGRYSLQMMVAIARLEKDGEPVKLSEISKQTSISRKYLEQLVIHLKNKGLVRAVCGKQGGYCLGQPAESITAKQVIEAATGPIDIAGNMAHVESDGEPDNCACTRLFQLVNKNISDTFGSYTLSQLAASGEIEMQKHGRYPAKIAAG